MYFISFHTVRPMSHWKVSKVTERKLSSVTWALATKSTSVATPVLRTRDGRDQRIIDQKSIRINMDKYGAMLYCKIATAENDSRIEI